MLLIWAVIIIVCIAVLRIIIPWILGKMAPGPSVQEGINILVQVFNVILWGAVAIVVLLIIAAGISCLISMAGSTGTLLPHR
jgi:hypothetical protein